MERGLVCVLSSWIPDQNPMPLSPPIFLRGEGRRQHKALDMTLDDGYSFKSFEAQELEVDFKTFYFRREITRNVLNRARTLATLSDILSTNRTNNSLNCLANQGSKSHRIHANSQGFKCKVQGDLWCRPLCGRSTNTYNIGICITIIDIYRPSSGPSQTQ